MPHNGIDIDQFILLTIYPSAAFFIIGFLNKKFKFSEVLKYLLQGIICIVFSIVYFIAIPHGGAQGLALILIMFGLLLLFMARRHKIHPESSDNNKITS